MANRKVIYWWRATCFNQPVGPWRDRMGHVREDLIAEGLGSFDDHNCFYVTVPGGIDRREAWVDYEDAA